MNETWKGIEKWFLYSIYILFLCLMVSCQSISASPSETEAALPNLTSNMVTSSVDRLTFQPDSEKLNFSTDDMEVYTWFKLDSVSGDHDSIFTWISPDNTEYQKNTQNSAMKEGDTRSPFYGYNSIDISQIPKEIIIGQWTVNVFLDDQFLYNASFYIENPISKMDDDMILSDLIKKYHVVQKELHDNMTANNLKEVNESAELMISNIEDDNATLNGLTLGEEKEKIRKDFQSELKFLKYFYQQLNESFTEDSFNGNYDILFNEYGSIYMNWNKFMKKFS